MPDRVCFAHTNVTGAAITPKVLKDSISESWWNAYKSSKFNFFPFPTIERDEENKPFSTKTHTWNGKTFYAEKFDNGCERLIPSTNANKPITPITENYSYVFKRDQLIKLFWRMKGTKLKIGPGNKSAPTEPTSHRYSNFEVKISSGGDFEKATIENFEFKEDISSGELKEEQQLINCNLGSGGSAGGYNSVNVGDFCRIWQSHFDVYADSGSGRWGGNTCAVGVDFSKPVIKIPKKPEENSWEDEYRPYVFCSCCQQCPRILMEVTTSIGCRSACGFDGFKDYEGCQSVEKGFKRKFRKYEHVAAMSFKCGGSGGTKTQTYSKCDCKFDEQENNWDSPVGGEGGAGKVIVSETVMRIEGKCTPNGASGPVDDIDTITVSEPWTKEELINCAKENYSKYPDPVFYYDKPEDTIPWSHKIIGCGASSNDRYEPEEGSTCSWGGWWGNGGGGGGGGTSGFPLVSVGGSMLLPEKQEYSASASISFSIKEKIYNNLNLKTQNTSTSTNQEASVLKSTGGLAQSKTGYYWNWWGWTAAAADPCWDYRRPEELDDDGKTVLRPEGRPIAVASFRLDSGAYLQKGKWRIVFIPPQSCYLKIWMKKATVFYDEVTGKESFRQEEDMPPLVWDGGESCNSLQEVRYFNQSGSEVEPDTNFKGNSSCAGISKTFVFISKYSCQRGYEPKDLTCKEIKDYEENPTEKYRKNLWQRNCTPDWVFDKTEDFTKVPRGVYSLEEWHCDL